MDDVGDQRLAAAEESVSRNSSANRLLTVIPRAHTAVSSGAGNPLQAEEECIGIPSGDIPSVPSESNGTIRILHRHLQVNVHHQATAKRDQTLTPPWMFDNLCSGLAHEQMIEAYEAYELP